MSRGTITVVALAVAAVACGNAGEPAAWRNERTRLDASVAFLERRLETMPDDILAPSALADLYFIRFGFAGDIEDVARADAVLRRALTWHPDHGPFLERLVPVHIARHEFPEAAAAAQAAFRAAPRRATHALLFDAYLEVGRFNDALAALRQLDHNAFSFLIREARFAEITGRYDIADRALTRACRKAGASERRLAAWCAVRQADIAAARGWRGVESQLERALDLVPDYASALAGLALLARQEGRPDRAASLWRRAAELPGGVEAELELWRIARDAGDSVEAMMRRVRFERRARDPQYGRAFWSHLAIMHAERGEFAEAHAVAAADLAQRPGPEAYITLAQVYRRQGDRNAALRALEEAARWTPSAPEVIAVRDSILAR
jgi:tetratricopeptide (TPR) repeat protein